METFYSDKIKKFECNIDVDGASLSETTARLALSFDKSKTKYLYEGTIGSNGKCTIKIPEIKNAPNLVGSVTLEVIAEHTYFEPWNDKFIIKQHKNVTVNRISEDVEDDDTIKINVDLDSKPKSKIKESNSKQSILSDELKEIINEGDFITYVKDMVKDKDLLEQYTSFEPKILTKSLGEMYGVQNESKVEKSILFYLEKKVI